LVVARNSAEMTHVIAGLAGGYHYGKAKEGKAEKEIPEKDGFYDHIFDSAQYAIDIIKPIQYAAPSDETLDYFVAHVEPGVGTEAYIAD
jgi:hypothetical protein